MDEAIATVVMVTGTSTELATQYVQLADGDPNQAVQLFFENGGADLTGASSQPPPPSTSHPAGGAENPIDIDAEEHISDDNDPEVTGFRKRPQNNAPSQPLAAADYEDDEAMARRLQQEMYGESGMDEGVVRAPIARQAATLVGPGADDLPGLGVGDPDHEAAVQERMLAFQRRRNQREYKSNIRAHD